MALNSQTARMSEMPRSYFTGRGRRRRRRRGGGGPGRLLVIASLALIVGAGAWWLWGRGGPERTEAAQTEQSLLLDPATRTPTPEELTLPEPESVAKADVPATTAAQTSIRPDQGRTLVDEGGVTIIDMGASARNAPAASTPNPAETIAASNEAIDDTSNADMTSSPIYSLVSEAQSLASRNRLVQARLLYNRALHDDRATGAERELIRERMSAINETLVFSDKVLPGDPYSAAYSVAPGDSLAKITAQQGLGVDWRLVQRVNGISDPRRIRPGQTLKLVKGPFHCVITKSDFRLDLYLGDPADGQLMYVRSFPVGLGEFGSTPLGSFVVRPDSKLINPFWVNPRTGEQFAADNPKNPLGEHWVGLDPADDAAAGADQYGLHGTIEPDTIGHEASMGCVRLLPSDIALVYELMAEAKSTVRIVP